jgi:peptidoglycan/LPS O-acetylase OafA/YrhL
VKSENTRSPSRTVPSLELIRGLASLDVFLFHYFIVAKIRHGSAISLLSWGTEAVIVFFVLSGYVIGLSQQRKHRGALDFFKARVRRICPIYYLSIGLTMLVVILVHGHLHYWQILGHLFFLQSFSEAVVVPLGFNTPLWSLGSEFQFYTLFAILLLSRRRWPLVAWWWIAIAALVVRHCGYSSSGVGALALETLSLSPCWLLGYFASNLGNRYSLSMVQALTLFAMIPLATRSNFAYAASNETLYDVVEAFVLAILIVPLIHTLAVRHLYPDAKPMARAWPWIGILFLGLSLYAFTHKLASTSFMIGFSGFPVAIAAVGLIWEVSKVPWPIKGPLLSRVSLFLGGASYAIYTVHYPLTRLVVHYTGNHLLQLVLLLPLIGSIALLLEYMVQPKVGEWFDRLWSRPVTKPNIDTSAAVPLPDQ